MAAERPDSSEKEFEATEQRLQQARQEGNVAQSKELNGFALTLGMLLSALVFQVFVGSALFERFSGMLTHSDAYAYDLFESDGRSTRDWALSVILAVSPVLIILGAVVMCALAIQQAIAFSTKKVTPDIKKISPVHNLRQRYGPRGLLDFLKDGVKLVFACCLGFLFLLQFVEEYYASAGAGRGNFHAFTFDQTLRLIIYFCAFQLSLAIIDWPLQRRLHANELKMTREEMKREMKQNEGDPYLKQVRRDKGAKISRSQMLTNVKTATVVITNPEHYAVALRWDPDSGRAPVCVAKGVDELAARIRDVATENGIPLYRDPPTARSLHRIVDIDEEIRPEHFAAVAAAIQFVERVRTQA